MIVMHGIFDLKDGAAEQAFKDAYDRFADHLQEKDLLIAWRFLRSHPHDCYNSNPLPETYLVAMEFTDLAQANASYAYVQEGSETIGELHRDVFSKLAGYRFVLYTDA
jgi:hypothetical protein